MAKRRKRLQWIRGLKGLLLGACLAERKTQHGSRRYVGFRVVRILRARYDRKSRQVVTIVARLYGKDATRNMGYNGPRVVLERTEYVSQKMLLGILVGQSVVPVDVFLRNLRKDAMDIPNLSLKQQWVKVPTNLLEGLSKLLEKDPGLAKPCGLPHEPRWMVKCPDGARVELAMYQTLDADTRKPIGEHTQIITYTLGDGRNKCMGGAAIPSASLAVSLRKLLGSYKPDSPSGRVKADPPNPQNVPPPATAEGKKIRKALSKPLVPKPEPKPEETDPDEDLFNVDD